MDSKAVDGLIDSQVELIQELQKGSKKTPDERMVPRVTALTNAINALATLVSIKNAMASGSVINIGSILK